MGSGFGFRDCKGSGVGLHSFEEFGDFGFGSRVCGCRSAPVVAGPFQAKYQIYPALVIQKRKSPFDAPSGLKFRTAAEKRTSREVCEMSRNL